MAATRSPPDFDPTKSQFFRPNAFLDVQTGTCTTSGAPSNSSSASPRHPSQKNSNQSLGRDHVRLSLGRAYPLCALRRLSLNSVMVKVPLYGHKRWVALARPLEAGPLSAGTNSCRGTGSLKTKPRKRHRHPLRQERGNFLAATNRFSGHLWIKTYESTL